MRNKLTIPDLINQLRGFYNDADQRSRTIIDNGREISEVERAKSEGYANAYHFCVMQLTLISEEMEGGKNELSLAQKVAGGLDYLLSFGKVFICAEYDLIYARSENEYLVIGPHLITHMESLGWHKSKSSVEGGFEISAH